MVEDLGIESSPQMSSMIQASQLSQQSDLCTALRGIARRTEYRRHPRPLPGEHFVPVNDGLECFGRILDAEAGSLRGTFRASKLETS